MTETALAPLPAVEPLPVIFAPLPKDRHPAYVYLARLFQADVAAVPRSAAREV